MNSSINQLHLRDLEDFRKMLMNEAINDKYYYNVKPCSRSAQAKLSYSKSKNVQKLTCSSTVYNKFPLRKHVFQIV